MELRIDHVSKQFKDKRAVEDVSLCITPGVWGLLGANGAGKKTLMRIIAEGTTEELVRLVEGKVWESEIPAQELPVYERKLRVVNLRNEEDGEISIRYLSDQAMLQGSRPVKPRLEDLYLWLFPQEGEGKR